MEGILWNYRRRRPSLLRRKRRPRGTDLRLFDGRTCAARRKTALVKALIKALTGGEGELDPIVTAQVHRCAELSVAAEIARAQMLTGPTTSGDLELLVKLEGELRRAFVVLGAPLRAKLPPEPSPGLAIAQARWAEQAAQEARKAREASHG
jgi:hypothetical protein